MGAAPSPSTWGTPPGTRRRLRDRVLALRSVLEDDVRRQLAALGVSTSGIGASPTPSVSAGEDARVRTIVAALIERARDAGRSAEEAIEAYVTESAYTFLNRAVAFRCLEERNLLLVDGARETLIKRDPIRAVSSLVWRVRHERPDLGPRDVAREAFRRACVAMSERIKILFDPDVEAAVLFPLLETWTEVVEVLNDPEIPPETYAEDEVLGWVYQYWNGEAKQATYAKLRDGGKIETTEELAAASCLYTERYIVDFLVQNTLGALWLELHPDSRLASAMPYYVPPPAGEPRVERAPKRVREISLLDPACGSGHFLVRAFDLFVELYREEGIEDEAEIPALILEHNLYGIDIDRRATQIAAFALYLKGCALAGPDFRPRRLHLVAADVVLPPEPPADFLARLDDPDLVEIARSLWAGLRDASLFGSLLHPERTINEAFRRLRARDRDGLWAKDDAAWQERRRTLLRELRQVVRREAGETDLGRHLFGAEVDRGLDLVQVLSRRYDVVVANPPYSGSSNLDEALKRFIEREYADGKRDLYAAFILRCIEFARSEGHVGMVTQQSWMFLRSFAALRARTLEGTAITTLPHLGPRAFEEIGGEVVNVALFTLRNHVPAAEHRLTAFRLVGPKSPAEKDRLLRQAIAVLQRPSAPADGGADGAPTARHPIVSTPKQADFLGIPNTPFVYWLRPRFFELLRSPRRLSDIAEVRQGLATADNDRFVRCFWEVTDFGVVENGRPARGRWFWYAKGGRYQKWAGLEWLVVDWENNGERIRSFVGPRGRLASRPQNTEYYFRPGLTYTLMARGAFGLRVLDEAAFDVAGISLFPVGRTSRTALAVLGNNRLASCLLRVTTQDLKFHAGYVGNLPLPSLSVVEFEALGRTCVTLKRSLAARDAVERCFRPQADLSGSSRSLLGLVQANRDAREEALLHALEGWNERLVFDAYGMDEDDVRAVLDETGTPAGWYPLIAGYDALPEPPAGVDLPGGFPEYFASLERRELPPEELAGVKARLRKLYEAGPGATMEEDVEEAPEDDAEEPVLGGHIPIPTETFLEELSQKLQVHPVSVYNLLQDLHAAGVYSPPEVRRLIEDWVSVALLLMLGYRWPEQDRQEAEVGPAIDPDLVDADGIIPLVQCGEEPTADERVRALLERKFGEEGAARSLAEFRTWVGRDLGSWLVRDFFAVHTRRFKNRPIAWHLTSPEGHFQALLLYHRLSRSTLEKLRTTYAGGRIARLRAEQARARDRNEIAQVVGLQLAIEDVEAFRAALEKIERGDELAARIRCRWKGEERDGRPGPYAPDIDDGVKVNIRPFQELGLLARRVITKW